MAKEPKKQIFILNCCDVRFSKIVSLSSISEIDIDKKLSVELFASQQWQVTVFLVLPSSSCDSNPYLYDAIFLKSNDKDLFEKLCNSLGKEGGWSEDEKACLNVPRK